MTAGDQRPRFDLVSLGESMLRFSVPTGRRLKDARQLDVEVGGAESNVCVAVSQLGWRCGWMGRLPDTALGDIVLRVLRSDGVDVSAVRRVPRERIGTFFIEYATAPRSIQVVYDRADSAAARMTVADVDWDYLLDTRVLHLTGITPALSATCYALVAEAIRRARAAGVTVSFDVNYRAKLWSAAEAGERLRPLLAGADLLFCKGADAAQLFGCHGEPREVMAALKALTSARVLYCTFGERGATLLDGDEFAAEPALPVQIVDRIGSGDAFAAGVLDAWLAAGPGSDLKALRREGLRRGVALAAIALSQYGDRVLTNRAELESVMAQERRDIVR
jgi:2-dehydro-3-deoxygluconokinase